MSFTDFVKEETLLQVMIRSAGKMIGLDVTVDRSPKGHPEVAGEGIEYTWANSKLYLRTVPISQRKTAQQFLQQVRLSLARSKGANLSKPKIRRFSARARDYIGAYHYLQNVAPIKDKQSSTKMTSLSMKDIERMKRTYRSHRGVERCDSAWCDASADVTKAKMMGKQNMS